MSAVLVHGLGGLVGFIVVLALATMRFREGATGGAGHVATNDLGLD
jgi:hypothetical protein